MIYNENPSGLGGMKLLIKATRNAAKSARNDATSSNLDRQIPLLKRRNYRNLITRKRSGPRNRIESRKEETYVATPTNWGSYNRNMMKSVFSPKRSKRRRHLQAQISILLFAYALNNPAVCTHRPMEASELYSRLFPGPEIHNLDEIMDVGGIIATKEDSGISTTDFDVLEEVLVSAISFLHTKNISYLISDIDELYFVYSHPRIGGNEERTTLRLLLGPNKSASLITNTNDSVTTLSNNIKEARSIFYFPKLIFKLSRSTIPIALDISDQDLLLENFKRQPNEYCHYANLCKYKIANKMYQLTRFSAEDFGLRNMGHECREVIDDYFLWQNNNDSTLSLPCTSCRCSPLRLCAFYRKILKQGYQDNADNEGVCHSELIGSLEEQEDETDSRTTISNTDLTYIICLRAKASGSIYKDLGEKRQWYAVGKLLYTTFLSHITPQSYLEFFFAGDCGGWLPQT
ncbi:hypothetical protein EAE96_008963 [Botrytis aclada]|nr:hypothetical protein EAE96_008963 [Botrytis aclada]